MKYIRVFLLLFIFSFIYFVNYSYAAQEVEVSPMKPWSDMQIQEKKESPSILKQILLWLPFFLCI